MAYTNNTNDNTDSILNLRNVGGFLGAFGAHAITFDISWLD